MHRTRDVSKLYKTGFEDLCNFLSLMGSEVILFYSTQNSLIFLFLIPLTSADCGQKFVMPLRGFFKIVCSNSVHFLNFLRLVFDWCDRVGRANYTSFDNCARTLCYHISVCPKTHTIIPSHIEVNSGQISGLNKILKKLKPLSASN